MLLNKHSVLKNDIENLIDFILIWLDFASSQCFECQYNILVLTAQFETFTAVCCRKTTSKLVQNSLDKLLVFGNRSQFVFEFFILSGKIYQSAYSEEKTILGDKLAEKKLLFAVSSSIEN